MSCRQELGVAQLLPLEARPCDWVADPWSLARLLGWDMSGETILGVRKWLVWTLGFGIGGTRGGDFLRWDAVGKLLKFR